MSVSLALVGLVVGLIVGLTSTGGGAVLTPALVLLGVPPAAAIGSDVLIASGMKLFGGGVYAVRRHVHWPTVLKLATGSIPGAALGVLLLNRIPPEVIDGVLIRALGGVLILAGAATLVRARWGERFQPERMPGFASTAALGFVIGVLVATTSVGSGSLLLCALVALFPLRPQTMVGTDLVHALFLSSAATVGHLFSGRVDFGIAAAVLVGGIPGVLLGAKLAGWMPQRALKAGLAVVLLFIGGHLSLSTRAPKPPAVVATVQQVAP